MFNQLQKCFLFQHLIGDEISSLMRNINTRTATYSKGEYIENFEKEVGIVLEGKIEVQKNLITGKKIIMNKIKEGNVFGIAYLFQHNVTNITSLFVKVESSVLFIRENDLLHLFRLDEEVQKNYLSYISERIYFLNQRVECFTHDNIRDRVIDYIEQLRSQQNNSKQVTLFLSKSELADYLGISRPSLYRVLKDLEEENFLKLESNKILLYD